MDQGRYHISSRDLTKAVLGRAEKNLLPVRFLRGILKKTLPRTFLKRAFLVYNQLKAHSWDKLFFAEEFIPDDAFIMRQEKNPFLELQVDLSSFSDTIKNKFAIWLRHNWMQDQYLLTFENAFIEPKTGWAVTLNRKLIYPSLGFSRAPHVHKPSWFETYIYKKEVIELRHIISLRDTGEENYFHFFNDVIPKIFFLQENEFDLKKYTVVVAENLYAKSYFQYYLKNTFLNSLTWHVQRNEWIHFDHAVFCKPYTHTVRFFNKAVSLLNVPTGKPTERKVFLTRGKNAMRHLQNSDEIIRLVRSHGYEIIDSAKMSFEEQVNLFHQTRYLIAVHGAGITNILFRGAQPLSLAEIVPSMSYIPFHYVMLARQFDYKYNVILGSEILSDGGFTASVDDVKRYLEQLNVE